MCHGFTPREWSSERTEEFEEELEERETDEPSFVEDEPAEDVEILTDGGDGDEE